MSLMVLMTSAEMAYNEMGMSSLLILVMLIILLVLESAQTDHG